MVFRRPRGDFCFAPHGTGAFSPLLVGSGVVGSGVVGSGVVGSGVVGSGGDGGTEDAGVPALAFLEVSAYVLVGPGGYDVRAVVGGASDCSTGVVPDMTSLGTLASGALATVALIGEAHPLEGAGSPLTLAAFRDDAEPKGPVGLRVINAAPSLPSADFGTGKLAQSFSALFSGVSFGAAGSERDGGAPDASPSVDSNGYASVAALVGATLSAHADGATTDAVVATNVFAAAGSLVTFVLVNGTDATSPASMLECVDNAAVVGFFASCTVASE